MEEKAEGKPKKKEEVDDPDAERKVSIDFMEEEEGTPQVGE